MPAPASSSLDWQPGAQRHGADAGGVIHMYETRARPALPADVVTILLGTNDLMGAFELGPVEPDDFRNALRTLAEALHADGAREVVLMSPPFMYGAVGRLTGYRSRIQELCREMSFVRCGPDLAVILNGKDFELMEVHPNASGTRRSRRRSRRRCGARRRSPTRPRLRTTVLRREPPAPRRGRRRSRWRRPARAPRGRRSRR